MYVPKHFEVTDLETLISFIRLNSFGILFSHHNDVPFATHLPFLIEKRANSSVLLSHMAKANPHWQGLDETEVLVVFSGPHAFVSSAWYEEQNVVPTWNYVAVHVYGRFRRIANEDLLKQVITNTLCVYEPNSHIPPHLGDDFFEGLLNGIVGFEIDISKIEGKWKLNQNHSVERQQRVVQGLLATNDPSAHGIAMLMQQNMDFRR